MQRKNLIDLPNDVLQLIVLSLTLDPLFTPRYTDDDFGYHGELSEYTAKCKEYYGGEREEHEKRAQGLLSWSVSCKHFRKFLMPYLLKTVVMRDTSRSIASVKCLSESTYWSYVQNFIFATTQNASKPKFGGSDSGDGTEDGSFEATHKNEDLRLILSSLPSKLQSLTLDLPEGAEDIWEEAIMESCPPDSDSETYSYRLVLRNVLTWVSINDFSKDSAFDLRIYNLSPYHSLAYDSNSWKVFLSKVSSFTLGLKHYDNGAGWKMNMHMPAIDFAPKLGEYFWDNLERVESFNLHCDGSWPLGAPDDLVQPLELPLPSTRTWHDLKHVSFKETFICTQMAEFLRAHLDTIETIELIDCFGPDVYDGENSGCETWCSFFKGLADSKPSQLRDLKISYVSRSDDDLIAGLLSQEEQPQRKENVERKLREQKEDLEQIRDEVELAEAKQRQKRLLAYCFVDDKYGMIFDGEETNVSKFLDGEDHKEWLRLLDVMVKNRKSINRRL